MEPSARSYNPSSQRVSRARNGGTAKQRESVAAQATPAASRAPKAATKAAAKPRTRRAVAKPRAEASAVVEQPYPEPEALERGGSRGDGAPAVADKAPTQADAVDLVESADVEELASPSEPGPLIGVDDFEDIFIRFQTPISNFIYRLVGNREQAFDLAQDVFVKAYRALSGGATIQGGALSSWLYRIASNTATDALRRRRLISWLPLSLFNDDRGVGAGMPGVDNGFGQQGLSEEHLASAMGAFTSGYDGGRFEQRVADREIVERVLKRLPEKYAACLVLYEHEGFSCAEIADVLHVTPSAVKMRLMRARERFISMYQQEMEGRR
jgi:RNA polymerase sigma-70 factor (ECF subfamily)